MPQEVIYESSRQCRCGGRLLRFVIIAGRKLWFWCDRCDRPRS